MKGSTLRSRSLEYKSKLTSELGNFALEKFKNGSLKTSIYQTLNWKEVAKAHQLMEQNQNMGKIVLKID